MAISKITTGSISDSVAIDTNTLVVDGANNRVGIGTSSPSAKTEITVTSGENLRLTKASGAYLGFHDGTATRAALQGISGADGLTFHTGSSVTERLRIDGSGRVTMPAQPRFSAYYAGNNNGTNNIASGGGELPLNATHFNNGGHFSTSTSRFTAPIAGVYQFNACFFGYYNSSQIPAGSSSFLVLRVNGSNTVYLTYTYFASTSSYPPYTGSVLLYLNASDYVTLYTNLGVYSDASNLYTHFSGYLIG
jgi:hypothetical protein